jgi:hypothetical protein
MKRPKKQKLTERIPAPEEVRQKLVENIREGRLLRRLLRLSESARKVQGGVSRGAHPSDNAGDMQQP